MKNSVTKWSPISELTVIEQDISDFLYSKAYIEEHDLKSHKRMCSANGQGAMCFDEPLEVKVEAGEIWFRENDNLNGFYRKIKNKYRTQLGNFLCYDEGEWGGVLTIETEKAREYSKMFENLPFFFYRDEKFSIDGNYCDMFDCGEYSYAVDNLNHLGWGSFRIIRIDRSFKVKELYGNDISSIPLRDLDEDSIDKIYSLEYHGFLKENQDCLVFASGYRHNRTAFEDKTFLFRIKESGDLTIDNEWSFMMHSSSNSLVRLGNSVFFGQNKLITRLNILTGEVTYFTNKNEEELKSLAHF